MPRIPLEDYITDIIGKTQRGLKLTDEALATAPIDPLPLALAEDAED